MEFVSGHGELWSAQLLHAYLESRGHSSTLARRPQGSRGRAEQQHHRRRLAAFTREAKSLAHGSG